MSYNNNIIQTLGVDDESTYGKKLAITVAVDTLGMCTISFGTSFSIRIPEDDVDALSGQLAVRQAVGICALKSREHKPGVERGEEGANDDQYAR